MKQAVLSLSGGMDSSTLLLSLLVGGYEVTALSFDYGQKHKMELDRAEALVQYVNANIGKLSYPPVRHKRIVLDGLSELLNSTLVEGGEDVPEGHYEEANMKETVVPNRNKIFSSIIQAVALSIATSTEEKQEVKIALGIHAGDRLIYRDCRQEFRDIDLEAFKVGNWDSEYVNYYTPFLHLKKYDILMAGANCCTILGLDFNEVYSRTNTSYKPIWISNKKLSGVSGNWYSDYKSAASVERIEAFIKLGRPDPVSYADETGPVSWETVKEHVLKVLEEHNSKN